MILWVTKIFTGLFSFSFRCQLMGETGCTDAVLADVFQVEKTSMRKVFK